METRNIYSQKELFVYPLAILSGQNCHNETKTEQTELMKLRSCTLTHMLLIRPRLLFRFICKFCMQRFCMVNQVKYGSWH
jgi:hypothetical protein